MQATPNNSRQHSSDSLFAALDALLFKANLSSGEIRVVCENFQKTRVHLIVLDNGSRIAGSESSRTLDEFSIPAQSHGELKREVLDVLGDLSLPFGEIVLKFSRGTIKFLEFTSKVKRGESLENYAKRV